MKTQACCTPNGSPRHLSVFRLGHQGTATQALLAALLASSRLFRAFDYLYPLPLFYSDYTLSINRNATHSILFNDICPSYSHIKRHFSRIMHVMFPMVQQGPTSTRTQSTNRVRTIRPTTSTPYVAQSTVQIHLAVISLTASRRTFLYLTECAKIS